MSGTESHVRAPAPPNRDVRDLARGTQRDHPTAHATARLAPRRRAAGRLARAAAAQRGLQQAARSRAGGGSRLRPPRDAGANRPRLPRRTGCAHRGTTQRRMTLLPTPTGTPPPSSTVSHTTVSTPRVPETSPYDADSEDWLDRLRSDSPEREAAIESLHELLLKGARFEVNRRGAGFPQLRGGDLDDLAQQAADDALVAVLAQARQVPRRQPLHHLGLQVRAARGGGQGPPPRLAGT